MGHMVAMAVGLFHAGLSAHKPPEKAIADAWGAITLAHTGAAQPLPLPPAGGIQGDTCDCEGSPPPRTALVIRCWLELLESSLMHMDEAIGRGHPGADELADEAIGYVDALLTKLTPRGKKSNRFTKRAPAARKESSL